MGVREYNVIISTSEEKSFDKAQQCIHDLKKTLKWRKNRGVGSWSDKELSSILVVFKLI